MAFKDRLKEARTNKHLTQEQLGNNIGLAKSTITGYEKGTSEPDMLKMIALMQTLDVDANYLLQDEYNEVVQEVSPTPIIDENKNHLLSNYDRLNAEGREKLVDYSNDLINTGRYKKEPCANLQPELQIKLAARGGEPGVLSAEAANEMVDLAHTLPSLDDNNGIV